MPRILKIAMLFVCLPMTSANALGINTSITIEANSHADGASTVNGSITVGNNATVGGRLETVNGTIRIGENAVIEDTETVNGTIKIGPGVKAEDIEGVNGAIRIGENATVNGEVSVVNGKIGIDAGSKVAKGVSNVNGEITIIGAQIAGDLSTVNGDVSLNEGANLHGNLTIEQASGWRSSKSRKPRVTIGPGSRVGGEIIVEREVELYISDKAEIGGVSGTMSIDQAVRFSGERP